jgi:hypothetical protein
VACGDHQRNKRCRGAGGKEQADAGILPEDYVARAIGTCGEEGDQQQQIVDVRRRERRRAGQDRLGKWLHLFSSLCQRKRTCRQNSAHRAFAG